MRLIGRGNWIQTLQPHVKADVIARMTVEAYREGDSISIPGSAGKGIHQVVSGYVKLLDDNPEGTRPLMLVYGPGDCFGETSALARRPHRHFAVAATDTMLRFLSIRTFEQLTCEYPEISAVLFEKLARSISFIFEYRKLHARYAIGKKVRLLLINMQERCARRRGDNVYEIDLPITIGEMAEFLGVTRPSVQKEITALKRQGIIDKQDARWLVLDLPALRRAAGSIPRFEHEDYYSRALEAL